MNLFADKLVGCWIVLRTVLELVKQGEHACGLCHAKRPPPDPVARPIRERGPGKGTNIIKPAPHPCRPERHGTLDQDLVHWMVHRRAQQRAIDEKHWRD